MTSPALSLQATSTAPLRPLRWIILLGASVLLHWVMLAMVSDGFGNVVPTSLVPPKVMTATLNSALPEPVAVAAEEPAAPVAALARRIPVKPVPAKVRPRPKPQAISPVQKASVETDNAGVASAPVAVDVAALPVEPAQPPAVATSTATDAATPGALTAAVTAAVIAASKPDPTPQAGDAVSPDLRPRYSVSLPPPVTLEYEVRYATRGNITRGSSRIDWQPADGAYTIRGEVTKFGFVLSSFHSDGAIDEAGIAPTLYAEKNARRSETNTHFQRKATPVVSFSASTDTFALLAGAQDRASILWQLSGIARGDRQAFVPGAVLDVLVAGVRDAEHWLIRIVGEEVVTLETGEARAWHLVRTPRAGTYDKRIDIWLAPEQQWYPVKLRYTEVNGDYLDLSLSAVRTAGAR